MIKNKRYCTVKKSLTESCKEVTAMRNGEKPKIPWRERRKEILKMKEELSR